jgi:hypothetical protein
MSTASRCSHAVMRRRRSAEFVSNPWTWANVMLSPAMMVARRNCESCPAILLNASALAHASSK